MAISVFRNFGFLTPKIPKIDFSEKKYIKNLTFLKFSKKNGIYAGDLHVVSLHDKIQVIPFIFYHQMAPLSVHCAMSWRQNFQSQFLAVVNIVHQNKLHHWNPEIKLHKTHVF